MVSDPQILPYLRKMGCDDVRLLSLKMLHLFNNFPGSRVPEQKHKNAELYRTGATPHLAEVTRGIRCNCCGKVGPALQWCPCKKEHYCSSACQNADWPVHKADHKAAKKTDNNLRMTLSGSSAATAGRTV